METAKISLLFSGPTTKAQTTTNSPPPPLPSSLVVRPLPLPLLVVRPLIK